LFLYVKNVGLREAFVAIMSKIEPPVIPPASPVYKGGAPEGVGVGPSGGVQDAVSVMGLFIVTV
jgi:hypothetical protein